MSEPSTDTRTLPRRMFDRVVPQAVGQRMLSRIRNWSEPAPMPDTPGPHPALPTPSVAAPASPGMTTPIDSAQTIIDQARQVPGFNELPDADKTDLVLRMLDKASQAPGAEGNPIPLDASRQSTQPLPVSMPPPSAIPGEYTTPGYQGLSAGHEGGVITAPPSMLRTILGTSKQYADYAAAQRPGPEAMQSGKEGMLPATGSLVGTAGGYAVGGPPGAAIGDVLGTTVGYGANVALGVQPFDLKTALTTIAPTAVLNAYTGLIRPAASALAKSSGAGKQAVQTEKEAGVNALNAHVQRYNEQQLAQESVQKTAFEQAEAAKQRIEETRRGAVQHVNAQQAAQETQATELVNTFNAHAQADYDASRALQDQFKATQQAGYQSDLASWQAVLEQQKSEKLQYARQLQELTTMQRTGNVQQARAFAESVPGIPTKEQVQKLYQEAQKAAEDFGIRVVLPETQKLRATLLGEAQAITKGQGPTPLSQRLTQLGNAGSEPMSLPEIQGLLSDMKAHVSGLRGSTSEYAARESRVYGRLIEAVEKDLTTLATTDGVAGEFRYALKTANSAALKEHTARDLDTFVTHDWLTTNPDGSRGFNARNALTALDSKANAQTRRYMQQTILPKDETGRAADISLYDLTKEMLTTMQSADYQAQVKLRELRRIGDTQPGPKPVDPGTLVSPSGVPRGPVSQPLPMPTPAIPVPAPSAPDTFQPTTQYLAKTPMPPPGDMRPGPLAVGAGLGARIGLLGGAAAAAATGNLAGYGGAGLALGGAVLGAQAAAKLLGSAQGQRTLLTLIREQGTRLTPTMIGFLTAAGKATYAGGLQQFRPASPGTAAPGPAGP